MIEWTIINAVLSEVYEGECPPVAGVSIDTRTCRPGELFIAIRGDNFDGHDFLQQAVDAGAVLAMVDRPIENAPLPLLMVDDTLQALAEMARRHRASMPAKVIAITGSCGKTTTRALTASILSRAGSTLASVGSYNNNIGLPLTLLKLKPEHQYLVQEMGTNNPGEIAGLTAIAQPDVAVVTMAAPVHLEGLKTVEGVAKEKGAIYQGLQAGGVAVINADDDFASLWRAMSVDYQSCEFSVQNKADVMADAVTTVDGRLQFQLKTATGHAEVRLPLLGKHNVVNVLAAASIAMALSIGMDDIKHGLEAAEAESKRLVVLEGLSGSQVIDDSYNANPVAVQAAIELLADYKKKRILVLGDMGELGKDAEAYHQQIGDMAKQYHIDALYCYGEMSQHAAEQFGDQGYAFQDKLALIDQLKSELGHDVMVLIKGSRSMRMDTVTQAIIKQG